MILCAVRWYLRYSLSLREVEELFAERGLAADHTTIWRWVQRYGPELAQRLRRHLKPTNKSGRSMRPVFEWSLVLPLSGLMPEYRLNPDDATAIASYLKSLRH